jgi:tRNA pseudouridine38-40 synthase
VRLFFRVEYDGRNYAGWQTQHNDRTVQGVLQDAFAAIVRAPCAVVGAGRTDAGVHARAQGAHIDLPPSPDLETVRNGVNAVLPGDIAIHGLRPVSDSFHARFSAVRRTYAYRIIGRKAPLWHGRAWMLYRSVDWEAVDRESRMLLGAHDFSAFCASGSGARSMDCEIVHAGWEHDGEMHAFTISANRFVYKMVRSIVGTLVDIGRGKRDGSIGDILESGQRERVGETAPARGLTLEHVAYREVD